MLSKKLLLGLFLVAPVVANGAAAAAAAQSFANSKSNSDSLLDSQEMQLILLIVSGYDLYQKLGGNDIFLLYSVNLNKQVALGGKSGDLETAYAQAILAQATSEGLDGKALSAYLKKFPGENIAEQLSRANEVVNALTVASEVFIPGAVSGELLSKSAFRFAIAHHITSHAAAGKYVDTWLAKNKGQVYEQKAGTNALTDLAMLESADSGKRVTLK